MLMSTVSLRIPADDQLIVAYSAASPDEKKKLEVYLSLALHGLMLPKRSLLEVMDEMSAEAQANGLTPEILEQILADDE